LKYQVNHSPVFNIVSPSNHSDQFSHSLIAINFGNKRSRSIVVRLFVNDEVNVSKPRNLRLMSDAQDLLTPCQTLQTSPHRFGNTPSYTNIDLVKYDGP
jgi:hypothetical protein